MKKFKKIIAGVSAVVTLASLMAGISANAVAYPSTRSMELRNVIGAPGNIGYGTQDISTINNNLYKTSYTFNYNSDATVDVNVVKINGFNGYFVQLTKTKKTVTGINAPNPNLSLFIRFSGQLNTGGANESGTWTVSVN